MFTPQHVTTGEEAAGETAAESAEALPGLEPIVRMITNVRVPLNDQTGHRPEPGHYIKLLLNMKEADDTSLPPKEKRYYSEDIHDDGVTGIILVNEEEFPQLPEPKKKISDGVQVFPINGSEASLISEQVFPINGSKVSLISEAALNRKKKRVFLLCRCATSAATRVRSACTITSFSMIPRLCGAAVVLTSTLTMQVHCIAAICPKPKPCPQAAELCKSMNL